jgi:S1-C subfamily serine protease
MEKVMTRINSDCRKSKRLTACRLTLLASVGALSAAMLLVGPGGQYSQTAIGVAPASAAESGMQHPVGFADIVAKVKPAVISVRVKLSSAAEPALLHDNHGDDEEQTPAQPGSPLEKFFRQFGDQFGQQFGPHTPKTDLALIKVDGNKDFPYVKFAERAPQATLSFRAADGPSVRDLTRSGSECADGAP